MASLLWGKVYFNDKFAGYLCEEPGNRVIFTYDKSYISSESTSISYTLPVREDPYISNNGLHPFFDNLVSEGWLEHAQSRLLGKREVKRFELLIAFGFDCAGAVSIIDEDPSELTKSMLDINDSKEMAVLTGRASLSGVQPKLAITEKKGVFMPSSAGKLSTHIAKFPSSNHPDIIFNEYLTTRAFKALIPDDDIVELSIGGIKGLSEEALIIKRFDRTSSERIHFEEFNQLLNNHSNAKYIGSHKDMSEFILKVDGCIPVQSYLLYRRILVGLLLGNTDMHLKNFAMFHTPQGFRLTPSYDQVSASIYKYKTVALAIAGASDLQIGNLKPSNIIKEGIEFGLSNSAIKMAVDGIYKNLESAKHEISCAEFGSNVLKNNLIKLMEKRWNGTFALIGNILSKKQ